jgi:hypothetical protein
MIVGRLSDQMEMEERTSFEVKGRSGGLKKPLDRRLLRALSAEIVFPPEAVARLIDDLHRDGHFGQALKGRAQNLMARDDLVDRLPEKTALELTLDCYGTFRLIRSIPLLPQQTPDMPLLR